MHDAQAPGGTLRFGEWLRDLRVRRRVGQAELARRCALAASYLSAVERSRRPPPMDQTIERIADGLALEEGERGAVLAYARQARQRWSTDKSSQKPVDERHLDELPGVDPLAALRCMLREAKRIAVEAGATVEVTSNQFRVVVRPDVQHGTAAVHAPPLATPST